MSILALVISLFGNITLWKVAHNNNEALCAFRNDIKKRHDDSVRFLEDHPDGIPGISGDSIRVSIKNQEVTLKALSDLNCINDLS